MKYLIAIFALQIPLFYGSCSRALYNLETVSPKKEYTVHLEEKAVKVGEKGSFPYNVFLSVSRSGQFLFKDYVYTVLGTSDTRFSDECPNHNWLADNVLWLGKLDSSPQTSRDIVVVHNGTPKELKAVFLTVNHQHILLFNLPPANTTKVSVVPYSRPSGWTTAVGYFNDDSFVEGEGHVEIPDTKKRVATYRFSIDGSKISITGE